MILFSISSAYLQGCSLNDSKPRSIRAHTTKHQGIAHAEPAQLAEHYCQECHGKNLAGGDNTAAPSCYTCHGRNWRTSDPGFSAAPADHTVVNGIYRHHPDRFTSV